MSIDTFIFSNERKDRLRRHLLFWLAYCSYFYIQSIPPKSFPEFFIGKTYFIALMNLICFAPVFIGAVYFFIYYLLPRTLQRKKYGLFVFGFLLVYVLGSAVNYFTATLFLYCTGYFPMTLEHKIEMGNFNTRWGMVIATVALGIKLSKNFYLQQKENLELLKRRTQSEMQLEKARIHPEMLLRSLDSIYTCEATHAPSMILELSELLSYSIYEMESQWVPLKKELLELKHLLSLEEHSTDSVINIYLQVKGMVSDQLIVPMTIVKLVEDTLSLLHKWDCHTAVLNIQIEIKNERLFLKLSVVSNNCIGHETSEWHSFINGAKHRMNNYYKGEDFQIATKEFASEYSLTLDLRLVDQFSGSKSVNTKVYESA
ncbi:MAG: histidine kinase [Flavisolibacter sp.]